MFDFKDLSPIDFEELVRDLLQKVLDVRMESFKVGRDKGIDFRFSVGSDSAIVQAKHYLRSGENALVASAKKETPKVIKLAPKRYIFVTSLPMSETLKDRIIAAMPGVPLHKRDIIGQEDLNAYLAEHDQVLKTHFKLWLGSTAVLERILNSGVHNRTETELALIGDMIPKFVQNASVGQAEDILRRDGTLIIAGDPGVGKTTLARMLASLHVANDWELHVVSDMEEAFRVAGKGKKKLVFFDDFLGQVELSSDHVRSLDQRLPTFLSRVEKDKDLRFVLTTREYILNKARILSRNMDSKQVSDRKYVLDVGKYTRDVKARILYNHIYFSNLTETQIASLLDDDYFLKVIDHPNFNPRLIDILTREDYQVISGEPLRDAMARILANPNELWTRPYRDHISNDGRALMLATLVNPPVINIANLRLTFARVAAALDPTFPVAQAKPRFDVALRELEGAVIAIVNRSVRFSNPGVRDFLQAVIIEDELLPAIVAQLSTYNEIKQAWTIFYDVNKNTENNLDDATRWAAALERMLESQSANPVERLDLCLRMLDKYDDCDFMVTLVEQAGSQLEATELDETDVSAVNELLENIGMHALPYDVQESLQEIVTLAICDLLARLGGSLTFDNINTLDETLADFGSNAEASQDAIHTALEAFLPEIDSEMSEFVSTDDFDEFENKLKKMVARRSYAGNFPARDLREKREALAEDEWKLQDDDSESYSRPARNFISELEASNVEIKSIFAGLASLE